MSGITSNQSEGFNSNLKQLQGWKEVPVDTGVLALHHLQVAIGMCGKEAWLV